MMMKIKAMDLDGYDDEVFVVKGEEGKKNLMYQSERNYLILKKMRK